MGGFYVTCNRAHGARAAAGAALVLSGVTAYTQTMAPT